MMTMQAVAKHNTHPSTWQDSGSSSFLLLSMYLFEPLLPAIFALFFFPLSPFLSPPLLRPFSEDLFYYYYFVKDSAWHVNFKALKIKERERFIYLHQPRSCIVVVKNIVQLNKMPRC